METFNVLVLAFGGVYYLLAAMFLNAPGFTNTLLFKFIPFVLGCCLIASFLHGQGLVIQL